MKKMMKKIKSNSFISKTIAILTICMVLMSSLSVSVFAADDDVSAANEETESITDVWTDVTHSIMSLLGTAQGVFYGSSGSLPLEYGDPVPLLSGFNLYPITNFPSLALGDQFSITITEDDLNQPFSAVIVDSSYESGDDLISFTLGALALAPDGGTLFAYYNPVIDNSSFEGWYSIVPLGLSLSTGFSLTFLGTLAVVGVAIALIMLLVYVISRFLRLRG